MAVGISEMVEEEEDLCLTGGSEASRVNILLFNVILHRE